MIIGFPIWRSGPELGLGKSGNYDLIFMGFLRSWTLNLEDLRSLLNFKICILQQGKQTFPPAGVMQIPSTFLVISCKSEEIMTLPDKLSGLLPRGTYDSTGKWVFSIRYLPTYPFFSLSISFSVLANYLNILLNISENSCKINCLKAILLGHP